MFGRRRSAADDLMDSIRRFQAQNPPDRRPTLGELTEASRAMTGRNRPQRPSALDAPRFDGPPVRRPVAEARSYTPSVSERIGGMFGRATGNNELGNSLASLLADWTPIGNVDGVMRDPTMNTLEGALSALPLPGPVRRGVGTGVNALTDAVRGIRAYHGSPHDFDRFDMSRIGTGEGAQAYGHGLYFAENEAVANEYRMMLAHKAGGNPGVNARSYNLARTAQQEAPSDPIGFLHREAMAMPSSQRREYFDAINNFDTILNNPPGRMYEVNINADPNSLLDWDAPLAEQPLAMGALADVDLSRLGRGNRTRTMLEWALEGREQPHSRATGRELMNALSDYGDNRAIEPDFLLPRGIQGVKYLDQGSRQAGDGSRNFVVFDDSLVEIMRKYGLGGLMGAGVAGAAATQGSEQPQPYY